MDCGVDGFNNGGLGESSSWFLRKKRREHHTHLAQRISAKLEQFFYVLLQTEQKTLWTPLQESSKLGLSNVAKQVFS